MEHKTPAVVKSVSKVSGDQQDSKSIVDTRVVLDVPARFAAELLTRVGSSIDLAWRDEEKG